MSVARVRRAIEREGMLLVTDPVLPSVSAIVAGEPVRGSWWAHPASHEIYAILQRLEDRDDVLLVKLVSGKQTLVDEKLWRAFFSIATSRARWQTRGLSPADRALLRRVETQDRVRAAKGSSVLESRLLVYGENVHTESGAHAKVLTSWKACISELGFRLVPQNPEDAKRPFDECVERWSSIHGKKANLPWQTR